MISFGPNIQKMIETYEGPFYVVNIDHTVQCICQTNSTKEPDIKCPYCLGTGHKITIKMIRGVIQESNGMSTMRQNANYSITKEIFVRPSFPISNEDIVIIESTPYDVYQIKDYRLNENQVIYHICYCTPKKYDTKIFMKQFGKIVGKNYD